MTAQQAADAAIEDGKRRRPRPLPERAFDAPDRRATARYAVRPGAGAEARGDGAAARCSAATAARRGRRGDAAPRPCGSARRTGARRSTTALVGAAYGALGDLDAAITGALHRLERDPLDAAAPPRSLAAGARKLPRARCARRRARPARLRDPRPRDPRGRPARPAGGDPAAGVRATADGVAATRTVIGTLHAVLAGPRRRAAAGRHAADAARGDAARDPPRARRPGRRPTRCRRAEHERLTAALGAALEALASVPGALETTLPAEDPGLR